MDFQTILIALLGGGVVGFVQYLITRHDNKHDRLKAIEDKITCLEGKIDQQNAVSMRVRILRFRDEMLLGQNHTHDSFQQVLSDIDSYEEYCQYHPLFKNNKTELTIDHIRHNYQERLEKHDFL